MIELNKKTLTKIFIGVGACILLYWLLHETNQVNSIISYIGGIVSPFITGAAIAFVLNVPMRTIEGWLKGIKKDQFRRVVAVVLTFVAIILIVTIVFVLLIPQVVDTAESLIPQLQSFAVETQKFVYDVVDDNPQLMEWLYGSGLLNVDWAGLVEKTFGFLSNSVSTILSGTFSAIAIFTDFVVDLVIAIVFAIYCLFQKETLARQGRKLMYAFFPEKISDEVIRVLRLSNSTFSNFLSGQCIEVLILGCLFAVSMAIFGMPYIPLVSVLVAVTAFIPVVGAFVGCFIGAFLILVNDPLQAVGFVALFLVLQQIENNLIYPRVVGTSIGLSGMWVLLAVAVGGALFGVAGMFLMIPVASVLYTLLREFTEKRLAEREIDADKLRPRPPELSSRFKEKRIQNKEIRKARREERKQTESHKS